MGDVMNCKKCSCSDNYGRKYCCECGAKLGVVCIHCGFINDERDKYCGGCGISANDQEPNTDNTENKNFIEGHKRFFSQYSSTTLKDVISQAEKLKSTTEEKVIPTFQQEDIDKLFSE